MTNNPDGYILLICQHLFPVPSSPPYIIISQKTNSSLSLQWPIPNLMEDAPNISYYITYQSQGGEVGSTSSTVNSTTLSPLFSGTLYNITVTTVGPQNLRSTPVSNSTFTRKYNTEKPRRVSIAYSNLIIFVFNIHITSRCAVWDINLFFFKYFLKLTFHLCLSYFQSPTLF